MSEKLQHWLAGIGLEQYLDLFIDNDLEWNLLPDLDQNILKDIGISSAGHRLRIMKAVKALRSKAEQSGADQPAVAGLAEKAQRPIHGEAERRQLTVMFCDLVGSTEMSQQLDPEDLRDITRAYQDACKRSIERFDGYVARYMGDGVLAYFGYPLAHEDDAERAVRAGLTLIDAIRLLDSKLGKQKAVKLSVRIGIATGLVVVGDLIGESASQERAVVGETPNLAARLQSIASPNEVMIGATTFSLCGNHFECKDVGAHQLKGISEAIPVWRVLAPSAAESRFDAANTAGLTQLFGREQEIALLLDRWKISQTGEGQLVVLSGEAGIGKSRLSQILRARIASENPITLRYQCSAHHTSSAFYPVINQLQFAAGFSLQDSREEKLDKLEAVLAQTGGDYLSEINLFVWLLSIPDEGRYPALELSPQERKEQCIQALIEQIRRLSSRGPLLFEVEDVHWIDPSTLELLSLVVDMIRELPVLVLATYRSGTANPWPSHSHVTALTLNRLTGAQCEAMVLDRCRGKKLPKEVLQKIVVKTDGVPLFVEELTKNILESGYLSEGEDAYQLSGPLPSLAIPASLQDSLMARLDRLGAAKQLAQIGSAIGREFPHELLRVVSGREDSELIEALQQLIDAELIFRRQTAHKESYLFKHALVQDAAYDSLLKRSRQKLHASIAGAISEHFPEQIASQPEVLARHWQEAGKIEKSLPYWLSAGKRESNQFAHKEAATHLNHGLSLLASLEEGSKRDQTELEFRVALGTVLRMSAGPGAEITQENYNQAVALCDRLPESPEQFAALWGKWINAMNFKLELGLEWTDRLQDLAQKLDDPGFLLQAHHAQWTTLFHLGRFADAYSHIEAGLGFYDEQAHGHHASLYGGHDPRICGGGFAAHALWMLGFPGQSLEFARQCALWSEKLEHIGSSLHVIEIHLLLYQFRREPESLVPWITQLETLCAENDLPEYEGKLHFNRGWLLASRGESEAGIDLMRQGLENQRSLGSLEDIPMFSERLAATLAENGQVDSALDNLEKALETAETYGLCYWLAEVHRRKGELLQQSGQQTRAIHSYHSALEVARQQQAKFLQLRALKCMARQTADPDQAKQARAMLAALLDAFSEGSETLDLRDARALLQ